MRTNDLLEDRWKVEAVLRDERAPVVAANASATTRTAARAFKVRAALDRKQGVVHSELLTCRQITLL